MSSRSCLRVSPYWAGRPSMVAMTDGRYRRARGNVVDSGSGHRSRSVRACARGARSPGPSGPREFTPGGREGGRGRSERPDRRRWQAPLRPALVVPSWPRAPLRARPQPAHHHHHSAAAPVVASSRSRRATAGSRSAHTGSTAAATAAAAATPPPPPPQPAASSAADAAAAAASAAQAPVPPAARARAPTAVTGAIGGAAFSFYFIFNV